jgi:plasmid maintenance system antidote protein VapI
MSKGGDFQPSWVSAPGETIADVLRQRELPPATFAEQIGYQPEQLNELLHGRAVLSADAARLLSTHLGASREFWLRRESQYRADLVRLHRGTAAGAEWLRELPLGDMIRWHWVSRMPNTAAQIKACLEFFGVPDEAAWQSAYGRRAEMAAFRTSRTFDSRPGAVAAWLRKGELDARQIPCNAWSRDSFLVALSRIRSLTRQKDPRRFLPALTKACAACGVAVVILRAPSGCRASGATRFLSPDKALLLLSFRYLSDDHFWFTFFHEAAHLILHGEEALFIEADEMLDNAQEDEASRFAEEILIPKTFRSELATLPLTSRDVIRFSVRAGVAPGIVVGQLQHQGRLARNRLNGLKRRFRWQAP